MYHVGGNSYTTYLKPSNISDTLILAILASAPTNAKFYMR